MRSEPPSTDESSLLFWRQPMVFLPLPLSVGERGGASKRLPSCSPWVRHIVRVPTQEAAPEAVPPVTP